MRPSHFRDFLSHTEPTNEARAEPSSLELCLARRRKTKGQCTEYTELGIRPTIRVINGIHRSFAWPDYLNTRSFCEFLSTANPKVYYDSASLKGLRSKYIRRVSSVSSAAVKYWKPHLR